MLLTANTILQTYPLSARSGVQGIKITGACCKSSPVAVPATVSPTAVRIRIRIRTRTRIRIRICIRIRVFVDSFIRIVVSYYDINSRHSARVRWPFMNYKRRWQRFRFAFDCNWQTREAERQRRREEVLRGAVLDAVVGSFGLCSI